MFSSAYKLAATRIVKIGLFIVPFIPLYVSRILFFPYITGKAFIFRAIVEICFAAWIFLAIFYEEYRPQKTSLFIAISIFISIVFLATIFGINPARSFWSNFERSEGFITYIHLFAYFLAFSSVFKKSDWKIFFNLFVIAGMLENFYALSQKLGFNSSIQGGFRVDGTIGNPAYLAAYLIFVLGVCVILWVLSENRILKWLYSAAGIFTLVIIYFTASRGPTLGILVGVILASILYLFLYKKNDSANPFYKKIAIGVLGVSIGIPLFFWLVHNTNFVKATPNLDRLTSLSFTEKTITSRFTIWGMGWEGVKDRPVLGWGPENFAVVFSKYYKPELWRQEPWFDRSHNIIFDWLINAGVLGLLAYLSIFITALCLIWKNYIRKKIGLEVAAVVIAMFLAYFFQNLFVFDNLATYIGLFSFLAWMQSFSNSEESKSVQVSGNFLGAPISIKAAPAVLAAIIVPLSFCFYQAAWKPLQTNLSLLNAMQIQSQSQDYKSAFESYKKALSYNTYGSGEIREQLTKFAIGVGSMSELDSSFKDEVLRRAILEDQEAVKENSLDPRSYLFLGIIYGRVGLLDDAINVMNEALKLSPKKQQIYFELADLYIQKKDYGKAVEISKTAYDLGQGYEAARINLVAAYILADKQNEADVILLKNYKTVDVPQTVLTQVYSLKKNYSRLIGIWQALVKSNPQNLEYRKGLAGAYLTVGRNMDAVSALQEAINAVPSFKTEGESYISQILTGK